jgi:hypothetical protein
LNREKRRVHPEAVIPKPFIRELIYYNFSRVFDLVFFPLKFEFQSNVPLYLGHLFQLLYKVNWLDTPRQFRDSLAGVFDSMYGEVRPKRGGIREMKKKVERADFISM